MKGQMRYKSPSYLGVLQERFAGFSDEDLSAKLDEEKISRDDLRAIKDEQLRRHCAADVERRMAQMDEANGLYLGLV